MLGNKSLRSEYLITADDLFKFLGALAMVTCHCFIFLVRGLPAERAPQVSMDMNPHFFLPGFMSMALPALAGYGFKKFLTPYMSDGYLLNLKTANIFKLLIGLILLDAIKNGLLFGFIHAFKWDVLAFVVSSLLLLMWTLKKYGTKGVWGLVAFNIAIIIVYAFFPVWLSLSEVFVKNVLELPKIVLFLPFSVLAGGFFFWIWNFDLQTKRTRKYQTLLGAVLGLAICVQVFKEQMQEPFFWASLIKLPISIFVQLGQGGGHIWPLFPWMLLVIAGFLFAYYESWIFKNWKNALGVYAAAQVVFNAVLFNYFKSFRTAVAVEDFFSSSFFEPRWEVLSLMITFFISAMIGYFYFLRWVPIRSKTIKMYSEGILLFYFVHLVVAYVLLQPAIQLFPGLYVYTLYPIVVNIISYFFFAGLQPLFEKHIEIKLIKR